MIPLGDVRVCLFRKHQKLTSGSGGQPRSLLSVCKDCVKFMHILNNDCIFLMGDGGDDGMGRKGKYSKPGKGGGKVRRLLDFDTLSLFLPSWWGVRNREELGLFSGKCLEAATWLQVSLNLGFSSNKILFWDATSL